MIQRLVASVYRDAAQPSAREAAYPHRWPDGPVVDWQHRRLSVGTTRTQEQLLSTETLTDRGACG